MRPFGTPWRRWEDNIKMKLREVEWTGSICFKVGTGGGLL
jgi:hypothetical protein